jgi:hypothetical protein
MSIERIGGRPLWQPSAAQRQQVRRLRAEGLSVRAIAKAMGIDRQLIRRECNAELGLPPVSSVSLYDRAQAGDVGAAIKWLQKNGHLHKAEADELFASLAAPPPHR